METPDHTEPASDPVPAAHVRSYECTFCKRGFSNAQALGGHMNIHRKDRAKLRQPSPAPKLSLHLPEWAPPAAPPAALCRLPSFLPHQGELRQLQLFDDSPPSEAVPPSMGHSGFDDGTSPSAELDLELRLGPEP